MFKKKIPQILSFHLISIIIIIIFLDFTFICWAQENSTPTSPWAGRAVFYEKGCIQCHSINGKGGIDGSDLGENQFYGTYLELAALMWNHFPKMFDKMQETGYQFPEFDQEEMKQLIAYLSYMRYIGKSNIREFKGRKLLKNKGCVTCHKFGGAGGDVGPDITESKEYLTPIMLAESMWNHGPNMIELFQEHDIERPELEENEISDLANGIRSYMVPTKISGDAHYLGDPVKGKKLSEQKGCMLCHSFRGVGGKLGPDFNEVDLNYSVIQIAGRMWNHGPKMWELMTTNDISIPVFEKGEMADVIAYLYSLKLEDNPGNVDIGQQIIVKRGCLSCHSLHGKGEDLSADLANLEIIATPLVMITAMWNHAPAMQKIHLEKNVKWPNLNGKDMADLYAYLRTNSQ
jgi:mono/diheme cytochrome c family protein